MYIRPIKESDLDALEKLASQGGIGLTNLPANRDILNNKIQRSLQSFAKKISSPEDELYFFSLIDPSTQQLIGTCAIESSIGNTIPFYSYKRIYRDHISTQLNINKTIAELHLVNDFRGATEVCSLKLSQDYRKQRLAPLLSRSRFLFIAQFPERFADAIIAEMRGVSDKQGYSPFWRSLGGHFFAMDFTQADYLSALQDKQFIADLMPKHPIYEPLLTKEAQAVIGQPHPSTKPAMHLLEKEGFSFENYLDIFDAGPTLQAQRANITSIKNSHQELVAEILPNIDNQPYLLSNTQLDFRACQAPLQQNPDGTVSISKETASVLNINQGDHLRFVS